jgi:hypothetical protein
MSRQPDPSPWPLADVVATLAEEFRGINSTSTIQRLVQECGHQFANARVVDFIPLLVHRLARERLHALTTSTDRPWRAPPTNRPDQAWPGTNSEMMAWPT